ncbi:MAG: hypothetical protein ASARMPREDX12_002145 [Alectoria sarmentosa]|nr:MAG: hypothetical protein ASARMPREDX12_002145 [Alectoria sarmentosa]
MMAQTSDCLYAAQQILPKGSPRRAINFTRRRTKGFFQLPKVFRYGTCVISVDVVQDSDEDKFQLLIVYEATLDLIRTCVAGFYHAGGTIFVGPKKLVYVLVFGRIPPPTPTDGASLRAALNVTSDVILGIA